MKKKVLITGANGFIGKTLMQRLADENYTIIPLVRKKSGLKDEIAVDFCDPEFVSILDALPKVSAVVHLGARIGWDGSSREELFLPNVLATAELVRWAQKTKAYFIFASAAIVCGAKNPLVNSKSKPNPDTDYGYSKWLAEEVIKMSGAKHSVLRISGVFGKCGPQHLGINKAIDDANNAIVPVQYGKGNIGRNYIYVKDLANIIKFCIQKEIAGSHLVSGSEINTIAEMLKTICAVMLPGEAPRYREGAPGHDQIVVHSALLPKARSFKDAIQDIAQDAGKTPLQKVC